MMLTKRTELRAIISEIKLPIIKTTDARSKLSHSGVPLSAFYSWNA